MKIRPHERTSALINRALDNASREEMQWLQIKGTERIVEDLLDRIYTVGWDAPPLNILHLRERILYRGDSSKADSILRLQAALTKDLTSTVYSHHVWRHENQGNVVWEFTGPTGFGKSSCMLGLMERFNGLTPENLPARITIDVPELPNILPKLEPGAGVIVDEQSGLIGEGSRTQETILGNLEDQIRLTQVDLYWGSPQKNREHGTTQGCFEAFAFNRGTRQSRFIVWMGEYPIGYADLDWASPTLWQAYCPIKDANVARARAAVFDNRETINRRIRELLDLEAVQLWCDEHRPKKSEWILIIKRYCSSLSTGQVRTMAEEIDSMLDVLDNRPDAFETFYGFEPTEGMQRIANQSD